MRILCLSDLHGRWKSFEEILAAEARADLLVFAGDLTDRGTPEQARRIVRRAQEHSDRVLAVAGNCDSPAIEKVLIEENVSLHGTVREIQQWSFLGLSGVPSGMPWDYRFGDGPFAAWLEQADRVAENKSRRILVSHTPPRGLRDRTHFRTRAGSRAIRSWVDRTSPALVVCGHIHEAHGREQAGVTTVVNCGPSLRGTYATISLSDEPGGMKVTCYRSPGQGAEQATTG